MAESHRAAPRGGRNADRTADAVGQQLAAMACERYELGVYDAGAERMTPRLLDDAGVMASVGWLKHRNANGTDIYIRPYGSTGLLLVDDVTPASLKRLYTDGLDPAAVVLTSPDNYQAWIRIAASLIAEALATAAARELAHRYGADLAAAKWRQFGRLSGFTNRKPKHQQADGRYPFVRFVVGRRGVAPAAADLLEYVAGVARDVPPEPDPTTISPGPPAGAVCVLVDEYRRRVAQHCERFHVDDWSRLDWMVTRELAAAHPEATTADLAAAIMAASPNVAERHRGRIDDYAMRTARKVLALVDSRRHEGRVAP